MAPYAAWRTFRRFLGDLVVKGMPSRIDHTVMVGKSGSTQSAIRKTLQFLDLTDSSDVPTPKLGTLLRAFDSDGWPTALRRVILEAYAPILEGLDLEHGTAQQLADRFRTQGNVSGNTLTVAVRFFLGAVDEAGVQRSVYFVAPPRPPKKNAVRRPTNQVAVKKAKAAESKTNKEGGSEATARTVKATCHGCLSHSYSRREVTR